MGIFRELHVVLTLCKYCSLVPYVPPRSPKISMKRIVRCYWLRIVLALSAIAYITWVRAALLFVYAQHFNNLTYIVWLSAMLVDTATVSLLLVLNGFHVTQYNMLMKLLGRIETAIDKQHHSPNLLYRSVVLLGLSLCAVYYGYEFFANFRPDLSLLLQIRWELLVLDVYALHLCLLLLAMGHCAVQLRSMCREAIESVDATTALCGVLRLRDDLLSCVTLVNRIHGILFLNISASWLVSITCIVYFDFVYFGLQIETEQPYLFQHSLIVLWKSAVTGGLFTVAGSVTERIKEITSVTQYGGSETVSNRRLMGMMDKLHIKSQFQDIRFSVYGFFTIDNSSSYMVVSSIVMCLVIVAQFRQLEIDNENKQLEAV